ncbi:PAS domain-containing protein, partial [Vibrio sp. FNV 38]|nr:PAS domain-containing protein [Vibrio sp. FNV 38]
MGHEQELIPGQIMKWVMFRPSLKLSYGEEQDVHPHHKFAYLKQLLQKLSKRSRMRLIQFLKMPLKGGVGRCTFIYDAGDQKNVVIFLEVNEVSSSECFGTVQIKSIIPSSVDTEWILMSLLKDTRKSVIIADQDLNIVCVNQYLLNHFDVIESDVVGQALSCLSCDSHANETFKDLLQEAHAGEDSWGGVVEFCKHNGDVTTHDVDIKKLYWCTDTLLY